MQTFPRLTIAIPCYNQPDYLTHCLASVLQQTYRDFNVLIVDDASDCDYQSVLRQFDDPRIDYVRNAKNLGALPNMFHALELVCARSMYCMVFHEDDLMAPNLLRASMELMQRAHDLAFVGTEMLFFKTEDRLPKGVTIPQPRSQIFDQTSDFVRFILRGAPLSFGSIIYASAALQGIDPVDYYKKYWTLCDRPFLCRLMAKGSSAVVCEPLVYSRAHGPDDTRARGLSDVHILNFLEFYRATLPAPLTKSDRRLFERYATPTIASACVGGATNNGFSFLLTAIRRNFCTLGSLGEYVGARARVRAWEMVRQALIALGIHQRLKPIWRRYRARRAMQ